MAGGQIWKGMTPKPKPTPEVMKLFFMLNSIEHKILNAHKYEKSRNSAFFRARISLECYFSCS